MFEKLAYIGVVFMGFSAIMNPISSIPIFLTLTHDEEENETKKIAKQSIITAFFIVVSFSIAGNFVLHMFNVTFTALRLAGGILVAIIGYDMLKGNQSIITKPSKETIEKSMKEEVSVAITPLGIPLLAGPGVIITAMNFSAGGVQNLAITIISFGILCLITYFLFISGKKIKKIVGASALKVFTRMMGLILGVIGIQMLLDGIYSAIEDFGVNNIF